MDEKDTVGAVEIGGRTRLCGLIGKRRGWVQRSKVRMR